MCTGIYMNCIFTSQGVLLEQEAQIYTVYIWVYV